MQCAHFFVLYEPKVIVVDRPSVVPWIDGIFISGVLMCWCVGVLACWWAGKCVGG